jgi:hypothetical protein
MLAIYFFPEIFFLFKFTTLKLLTLLTTNEIKKVKEAYYQYIEDIQNLSYTDA